MTRSIVLGGEPSLAPMFASAVLRTPFRTGRDLPDLEVRRVGARVDRDQLARYARVCGFDLSDALPATYVHVLVFALQTRLMADAAFPFPLVGSVHLANTITQHRPIDAGETLDLRMRAQHLRPHFRGAQVDLVGVVRVGEEVVWEETSTYLFRGQQAPGSAPPRGVESGPPDGPGAIWRLDGDLGRRYAAVAGDVNPIHLHPWGAKALGFPGTIAHGMWSASRVLGALAARVPDSFVYHVEFKKPVLIPSTVRFVAEQQDSRWELSLVNARRGVPHLRGSLASLPV